MATDNKDNKLSIGSSDYAEILRNAAQSEIPVHLLNYQVSIVKVKRIV